MIKRNYDIQTDKPLIDS